MAKARSGATRKSAAGGKREKLTAICLALPGAECEAHGSHATYRVRRKVFAYFLDDHHGDGIVAVAVKAPLGEHLDRVRLDPERCYLPDYIGPRGWFALRLDRSRADWREVAALVERSYRMTAPATLLRRLDASAA